LLGFIVLENEFHPDTGNILFLLYVFDYTLERNRIQKPGERYCEIDNVSHGEIDIGMDKETSIA
jgi:hypothetical protein